MKSVRIHLDAHAHLYPFHDVPRLLLAALDHMPRVAPTDLRVLCLGCNMAANWLGSDLSLWPEKLAEDSRFVNDTF